MFVHIGAFSAGSTGHHVNGVYIDGQDSPLDETFFASMRQTLENARKNGCMVAFRFRYDYIGHSKPEPSTFDYLLYHISQIKDNGLLDDYKDIIAFVESGFTGKWGEQHDGKYTSPEYNAKVLDAMLDCVPDHIPVTVRTPATFAAWAGISISSPEDFFARAVPPAWNAPSSPLCGANPLLPPTSRLSTDTTCPGWVPPDSVSSENLQLSLEL